MRPIVLLSAGTSAEGYRTRHVVLGAPYVRAVEPAGATGVIVSPAHAPEAIEQLLELAGGLVLTGGEDIAPSRYGAEPHPALAAVDHARDALEVSLLERALERRMPVLGICRGLQLLNVALGGTLYQDLAAELGGSLVHEQQAPIGARWHGARVEAGSRLAEIFGETELKINSFHHQGIREISPQLRALAWAEDGLVEAVEAPAYPWVMGVQWHPERGEAELRDDRRNPDQRLFWAFVHACREYAAERRRDAQPVDSGTQR